MSEASSLNGATRRCMRRFYYRQVVNFYIFCMAENQQSGGSAQSGGPRGEDAGRQNSPSRSDQGGGQQRGERKAPELSWGQPAQNTGRSAMTTSAAAAAAPMPNSSRLIGMFVAGLIIGLLIAWAWFDLRGNSAGTGAMSTSTSQFTVTGSEGQTNEANVASSATSGTQNTSQTTTTQSGYGITVPSTQKAGSTVEVSSLTAGVPVWVVVYSHADRSGQIMGALRFGAGKTSGTIDLVHMTQTGKTYYVGLAKDTADHAYHQPLTPILGDDGKQVMAEFTAQ
jgi:hypothetical protein